MPHRKWMLSLDVLLFVVIALLYSPLLTGLSLHEALGCVFIVPFVLHLLFSWAWIKQSTKRFPKDRSRRHRLNYLLNLALFVLVVLAIVSGLVISQVLLPSLGIKTINDWKWRAVHNQSSVGIVVAVSFHLAMNWQRIVFYFQKQPVAKRGTTDARAPVGWVAARELKRSLVVALVAGIIAAACFLLVGTPAGERISPVDDIARLKQNLVPGSVQLTGTIITIVTLAYIAYRWLKIRL